MRITFELFLTAELKIPKVLYKDSIGIKSPTKLDMLLNKQIKLNGDQFSFKF